MPCFVVCPRTAHTTHHLALQSLKMFYHSPANIFFILPVQHWYFHQSNFKTSFLLYTTFLKHLFTPLLSFFSPSSSSSSLLLYLSPLSSLLPSLFFPSLWSLSLISLLTGPAGSTPDGRGWWWDSRKRRHLWADSRGEQEGWVIEHLTFISTLCWLRYKARDRSYYPATRSMMF